MKRFTMRVSASRLKKGLLAIPQEFKDWFPREKGQIHVVFDDEEKTRALTFNPYGPEVKENRIFGVGRWFSKRGVREGDLISITLEDQDRRLYRISLDRFVRERAEQEARQKLHAARTDAEAEQELSTLARLTRKRPRELVQEELLRIARESLPQLRPVVFPRATERHGEYHREYGFYSENCMMGSVSFVRSLSKSGTANHTLKFTILTRRSAIIQATCW
jgi:hypothetical protein